MRVAAIFVLLGLAPFIASSRAADLVPGDFILAPPAIAASTNEIDRVYEEGLDLARKDQMIEAMLDFGKVLSLDPNHRGAQHMMGLCCWLVGNTADGVNYVVHSARRADAAPETFMLLAAMSAQRGHIPESVGWIKKAFRGMSEAQQNAWIGKEYFRNVRESPVFKQWADEPRAVASPTPADRDRLNAQTNGRPIPAGDF